MWNLHDRNGQYLGNYAKLEAAMGIVATGEIGMKWLPLSAEQFIGLSSGGAVRFTLIKQATGE